MKLNLYSHNRGGWSMKRKIITILICITMLTAIFPVQGDSQATLPSRGKKVAESQNLVLYYSGDPTPGIIVEDKRNDYIWTSFVSEQYYDSSKLNDIWKNNVQSLFFLDYIKVDSNHSVPVETSSVQQKTAVKTKLIENGIVLTYNFLDLKIRFQVNITLEEDRLNVKIPKKNIYEYGEMGIVHIRILPFFGASRNDEDGYVFYPDGCGAISYFNKTRSDVTKQSWHVYGYQNLDIDDITWTEKIESKDAQLPVFGVKKGNNAFLAVLDEGEHDSIINYEPSRLPLLLNRIYAQWVYRRTYMATLPNASMLKKMEKEFIPEDKGITYIFMTDENADYSGMSKSYRNLLIKRGQLNKVIDSKSTIPLALDFFMGITEERVLVDKFIPMTTFNQVKDILEEINEKDVDDIQVNLIGWAKDGYGVYPSNPSPNRSLGGTKELELLAKYIGSKKIKLYLQDNYVNASNRGNGFSPQSDGVRQSNSLVATNIMDNKYLYNSQIALEKFTNKTIPALSKYLINGITFDKMGTLIYYDSNLKHPLTRMGTSQRWGEMINESKEHFGSAAVIGGNAYVLEYVDRLMDIPDRDMGYYITDETIPFYQMVVHGSIPYSGKPINLFYDPEMEKLKMIEYGYMPYYKLTYRTPEVLKYTDYNDLFTSYYKDWSEHAINTYKEFNQKLGITWDQYMIKHEKIMNNVYKITYSNDTKIYVNYKRQAVNVDGHTIAPVDYLVVDGRGMTI